MQLFWFQCALPVFEGLLPEPHNKRVMDLLFVMTHWHGLAKLRLHTDGTLEIMDGVTTSLGNNLREFEKRTCSAFVTRELQKEANARIRREAKKSSKSAASKTLSKNSAKASPVAGVASKGPELDDTVVSIVYS